jgi:hypothetical protein
MVEKMISLSDMSIKLPQVKKQLFMCEDGTHFEWRGELYQLLSMDDDYKAKVLNSRDVVENFNGCAMVTITEKKESS